MPKLRITIKVTKITLESNGLFTSLLVFGTLLSFHAQWTSNKNLTERFSALSLTRAEIESVVSKNRIKLLFEANIPRQKLSHMTRRVCTNISRIIKMLGGTIQGNQGIRRNNICNMFPKGQTLYYDGKYTYGTQCKL